MTSRNKTSRGRAVASLVQQLGYVNKDVDSCCLVKLICSFVLTWSQDGYHILRNTCGHDTFG